MKEGESLEDFDHMLDMDDNFWTWFSISGQGCPRILRKSACHAVYKYRDALQASDRCLLVWTVVLTSKEQFLKRYQTVGQVSSISCHGTQGGRASSLTIIATKLICLHLISLW